MSGRQQTHNKERAVDTCVRMLEEIIENNDENKSIEVEGRIGMVEGNDHFISGVKREEFYCVLEYLRKGMPCQQEYRYEHIYRTGNSMVTRYVFDNKRCLVQVEDKKRINKTNIFVSSKEYCLRLALSEETVHPTIEQENIAPDSLISKREKRRFIFVIGEREDMEMDFTVVSDYMDRTIVYEIELEFKYERIREKYKDATKPQLRELAVAYMGHLSWLKDLIKKSHGNYFNDIESVSSTSESEYQLSVLRKFVCDAVDCPYKDTPYQNLPGAMPVNFGRTSFDVIQRSEYVVSEKTDGVRHFVLVMEDKVYLINRKFDFFSVDHEQVVQAFGKNGVSLFDGEIVRNLDTMRPVLMLFDAIIIDGTNITRLGYKDRIHMIEEVVKRVHNDGGEKYPFDVIMKRFFHKEDIRDIFKLIDYDSHIQSYCIKDELRHHRSDGIVFSPDIPYQPFTNPGMFKWKYMTHWTIDFGIWDQGGKEMFYCKNKRDPLSVHPVNFSEEDRHSFKEDKRRYGWDGRGVVETSYDVWKGIWKYHIYRYDKPNPNGLNVCIDTLETMACNISREELQYRCSVRPEDDHWDELLKEAKKKKISEAMAKHTTK